MGENQRKNDKNALVGWYVAKGLAKQSQQAEQSEAETEKDQSSDTSIKETETSSTLATLSQNGRVWFIYPVAMVDYFNIEKMKKTETWDKVTNWG